MRVGIGLPTSFPSNKGFLVQEWAIRADSVGFSSIGVLDRLVYDNFDPLITLAAAAAVTERIRLMTSILIVPIRNAGMLAKEVASLDFLSNGRLTLGVGVGNREDDFSIANANIHDRGQRFENQLKLMKNIWSDSQSIEGVSGIVGPCPVQSGGPPLIFGGRTPKALERIAKWGEGYVTGSVTDINGALLSFKIVEDAWNLENRQGKPLFVGSLLCAIGQKESSATLNAVRRYYSYQGGPPSNAPGLPGKSLSASTSEILSTVTAIREKLKECEAAGMDEIFLRPAGVTDPDQVDRLAEAIL